MSIISYAQNFEDVILYRVLKSVKNGFYVDVGAYSPESDSVTKLFYDEGWSGINIDPIHEHFLEFESQRGRDINLEVALSDFPGEANIQFLSNPGLCSLDKVIAESHTKLGFEITEKKVKVTTLTEVLSNNRNDGDIHFLKIDVEGLEERVIKGNDWIRFRPWVLVIEATLPMSTEENYFSWEPILLNNNYNFVYADGLNRFYLAKEHAELTEAFKYPPNVFDQFVSGKEFKLHEQTVTLRTELNKATLERQNLELKYNNLELKFTEITNSKTWKLIRMLDRINTKIIKLKRACRKLL